MRNTVTFKYPGAAGLALALLGATCGGATFALPADGSSVVGGVRMVTVNPDNTLLDVMRHFDVGYDEITSANRTVSVWKPGAQTPIVVPGQFVLPPRPWTGIVINIPQRRLFYFPAAGKAKGKPATVMTYPLGIAREGWPTPLGSTRIVAKYRNPSWFVPQSIRAEHLRDEGAELPEYFPPGPDNPMGMLAMRTGFPGIYIHATNRPWGVGLRTSHGCLHLYPEDAAELFPLLPVGTPVRIIDRPAVVGLDRDRWVMSTYSPVNEYGSPYSLYTHAALALGEALPPPGRNGPRADIAWSRVRDITASTQPVPTALTADFPGYADTLSRLALEYVDFAPYGMDANNAQLPGAEPPPGP
ncbi:L,D-transpeptidase family protein [Chitinimonas koreensis]|uniref:L,D-transpeptidase family protein n=1 Tax=Chitinimonas koreensis TaxID=356302 RepID=UPI00042A5D34|nr:L,D-transpeptidase family protein [Chitinimonas koreensis]QNM97893.1 L,D-transpeptidase family protein [Chitinimonas koreensis]